MASEIPRAALGHLDRLFVEGAVSGLPDDKLLDRFLATRDGAAFEALMARHGPLVLRVCRAVLRSPSDAEDVFQATFLILVKKARATTRQRCARPARRLCLDRQAGRVPADRLVVRR
jgi:DNA-directed RNA polymerase specialized sigma24 family protein